MGAASLAALFACVVAPPPTDTAVELPPPSGDLVAEDAQNYSLTAAMDAPSIEAAELSDVTIDWSALTADIQCHDLDPAEDIDNVALIVFPDLTEEEVEAGLVTDTLQQVNMGAYVSFEPDGVTETSLSQLTFFGTDADIETYFEEGSGAWMVLFTTGTQVGLGARGVTFLRPSSTSTNQDAEIDNACGTIELETDVDAGVPMPVPMGGPWTLDWSGLTVDGLGLPLEEGRIDRVMVGWYAQETVADLEADFFDLELLADGLWTLEVPSGTEADLTGLADAEGGAFPGFAAEGSWILALRCSLCRSPAPPFLTVLEPR